jgi:phage tail tape-measure protein
MKHLTPCQKALTITAIAATLSTGCSSSSNTQRGAAGGAAIGAVAGAIVGNNRGSGNAASGAAIGAAAGAIAGGAIGNRADRRERSASAYGYEDAAVTNIYIEGSPPVPPAPLAESITRQPSADALWIPGYWTFENGNRYEWVSGRWEIPPRGAHAYYPPYWKREGNGAVYVRGHWR